MILEDKFTNTTDEEIISRVLGGDVALFELLVRRNNPYIYKTGRSFGFNHEDVEDLMQEAHVSAYLNLAKFEGRSAYRTWLVRIMINLCNQKTQKASFKKEVKSDHAFNELTIPIYAQNKSTDMTVLNKELTSIVENALQQIPVDYRAVFALRELNGMSVAETADLLHITETNVKVRLNRARRMLRIQVEKIYQPHDIFEFNLIYCDRIVEKVMKRISELHH